MDVRLRAALLATVCLAAVAGCGGGGGGSSGSSRLQFSPQRIDLSADSGTSSTPTATTTLTVTNPSSSGVYVGGTYTMYGIEGVSLTPVSATKATLTLAFKNPSLLGPGTYKDSVSLGICTDSSCTELRNGTEVTLPVTYTVTGLAQVSLVANPATAGAGLSTTLTWSSKFASSCTASGEWSGARAVAGSEVVTLGAVGSHTYTLTCSGSGSPASASVVVDAVGPSVTFSAFPTTVTAGKTVTLRWTGENSDACTASGDWSGNLPLSGYRTLLAATPGTLNFQIACSNATAAATAPANATVTVTAAPLAAPATAYRMNESHDGVLVRQNGASRPASSSPTWTVDLGAPVSYPLIADGLVFVTTANPDGSYGNSLYALDASTGAVVWGPIAVPGTYFGSGLTYESGRVFVLMFDGVLRAYSAATGAALWTTQARGYWYTATPTAYGGMVFLAGNGGLSAVDAEDGSIVWESLVGATAGWESLAVTSEGVYIQIGYSCDAIALEPVTGALLWKSRGSCRSLWGFAPVARNGVVYGRSAGSVSLFDATTGAFQGQLGTERAPAVTDTAMIAMNPDVLSATRLSDRAQTWTFAGDGHLVTAPVVVNDTVFVGSSSGNVYGLDVETGIPVWTGVSPDAITGDSETGGPRPPSGPAAGENLLIFVAGNSLVAWELH